MPPFTDPAAAVAWLRTPGAIRSRCGAVFDAGIAGTLAHFAMDLARLDAAAGYVIETIRANYPDLDIPYHSRWRHFAAGGTDRWAEIEEREPAERARIGIDLAVTSVLLDAGAGPGWRYREAETGRTFARSEGLAVASFRMFASGAFSARPDTPLRADGAALAALTVEDLARAFQADADNPLVGLDGRAALLRGLDEAMRAAPALFGDGAPRIGGLFDHFSAIAVDGRVEAVELLRAVLDGISPIWPGRLSLGGVGLGDVWRHPAAASADLTDGLVPFHKLSQWLAYSLVEPLEEAGIDVVGLSALTGLPEYRNGGLLVDLGVLVPKHDGVLRDAHAVDSELVVEWRALTVVLLDRLAERVRQRLGRDEESLPLAKVLEGGTWAAGRRIAAERRPDGGPPIAVVSDGTVF